MVEFNDCRIEMTLWFIENNTPFFSFSNSFANLGANILEKIVSCRVKFVFKDTTNLCLGIRNVSRGKSPDDPAAWRCHCIQVLVVTQSHFVERIIQCVVVPRRASCLLSCHRRLVVRSTSRDARGPGSNPALRSFRLAQMDKRRTQLPSFVRAVLIELSLLFVAADGAQPRADRSGAGRKL